MATKREIEALLKLKDQFSAQIQKANKNLKDLNKQVKQNQRELEKIAKQTSFKNLAKSIVGAQIAMKAFRVAVDAIKSSISGVAQFEASMLKLHTLVGLSTEEVKGLSSTVLDLSKATGKGPQELAEALYFVESAGLRGADALEALTATAKASAVGLGDMAPIADAVTSAVNAYGSDVLRASEATDVLLMTVREGKTAPEELSASIGQILPIAQQMGVSLQEVGAGVASLTRIGAKSSDAITQLRSAMVAFLKPRSDASKIMAKFGLSADKVRESIREKGLLKTLSDLRETFAGQEDQLAKVIGRVEGLNAVLALTGERGAETEEILNNISKGAGVVSDSFEDVSETVSQKYNVAMANLQQIGMELATEVMPAINTALTQFNSLVKDVSPETKKWAVHLGLVVVALGPIVKLATKLGAVASVFIGAFLGVTKTLAGLYDFAKSAADTLSKLWQSFKEGTLTVREYLDSITELVGKFPIMGKYFETGISSMDKLISSVLGLKAGFSDIPPVVRDVVTSIEPLVPTFENASDIASAFGQSGGVLDQMISKMKETGSGAGAAAKGLYDFTKPLQDWTAALPIAVEELKSLSEAEFNVAENSETMARAAEMAMSSIDRLFLLSHLNPLVKKWSDLLADVTPQMQLTGQATRKAAEDADYFNQIMQQSANLVTILGNSLGSLVASLAGAASGFQSLFGKAEGGLGLGSFISKFTKEGKASFSSILGGIASTLPAIGAIAGPLISGISKLFKLGGPNIARDVARDLGPHISEGLEKAIEQSGRPVQLAIADIFREGFASGTADANMLAREIGDLFSGFERGEYGKPQLIQALEEATPLLLERLGELGPAGEAQLQRIIGAAREMGVEFQGLSELIAGTFAPDTMEEIAKQFGITNDQVRELAGLLDVDVQTNLERMASNVGLSVEEFKKLGAAVKDRFGIPMDQIAGLLESMGINAEELATALGVKVSGQAGTLGEQTKTASDRIKIGADHAAILADQLERAARAAGDIHIPSGVPGLGAAIASAQGGMFERLKRDTLILAHAGELAAIFPREVANRQMASAAPAVAPRAIFSPLSSARAAQQPSSGDVHLHVGGITVSAGAGADAREIGREVVRQLDSRIRNNRTSIRSTIVRAANRG